MSSLSVHILFLGGRPPKNKNKVNSLNIPSLIKIEINDVLNYNQPVINNVSGLSIPQQLNQHIQQQQQQAQAQAQQQAQQAQQQQQQLLQQQQHQLILGNQVKVRYIPNNQIK